MSGSFLEDPKKVTLEAAKEWLRGQVAEGAVCPCCTQFAKVYRRPLNASMAYALILIEKYFRLHTDWLHVPSYLNEVGLDSRVSAAIRGDWAKLVYWELLEAKPGLRDDGSPRVGFYKITQNGRAFVAGNLRVPKYAFVFNEKCLRMSAETVSVREALGERFDYAKLMAGGT